VHGAVDAIMQPCELYWILIRLGEDLTLPARRVGKAGRWGAIWRPSAHRTWPGSTELPELTEQILSEHRVPSARSQWAAAARCTCS